MKEQKKNIKRKQTKKFICFGIICLVILLIFAVYTTSSPSSKMTRCIFCDIVAGKLPDTKIEVETDEFVIFKDIKPASTYHYLAVTKKHIESLKTMTKEDIPLVNRMEQSLKGFLKSKDIDTNDALYGFHMPPFISVKHVHMHAIAPKSNMTWMSSFMFKPGSYWFKTPDEAREYLENKV